MEESKHEHRSDVLQAAARERGFITLEELMGLASGSPVDLQEATALARDAGINLVEDGGDAWEHLESFADEGPSAFVATPDTSVTPEDVMAGGPAALYLKEISQTPLLTPEEEIHLAKQLEAGKAAAKKLGQGVADAAARAQLEEAVRVGEAARKRLIESNLRLVIAVARKYIGRGLSFLDLVQEGNIGLHKGVDKFDWRRGFRFSTYAYWWIRQAVSRAVADQGRTIRLPVHIIEQLTRLYNTAREIEHELGHPPTPVEIAQRLGVEPEKVTEAFRAAKVPISLETPIGDQEDSTVADLIADAAARAPAEEAEEEVLAETLDQALDEHLSSREKRLLQLRFGIDRGGEQRTLGEVAQDLGISRERVRQLEGQAIRKLRKAVPFQRQFREYVE